MLTCDLYLLSVMCYWNKVIMVHCQVMKSVNTRTNEINSDNSEQRYVHLSNGLVQSFEICYTFRVAVGVRMSHLSIVWWWFAITFCHFSCVLKGVV